MDEKALCEFVERWNCEIEKRTTPMPRLVAIGMIEVLSDLMTTHDADAPQWVEASTVARDGTRYWARVDARSEIPFIGPLAAIGFAKHVAQRRAEYLANMRGGAAS